MQLLAQIIGWAFLAVVSLALLTAIITLLARKLFKRKQIPALLEGFKRYQASM